MKYYRLFMPYCLQKLDDNSYIILNRNYKPLGCRKSDWVEYETDRTCFSFKRNLSQNQINSIFQVVQDERYYFYNDGTKPWRSKANEKAYFERLSKFAQYELKNE